MWGVEIEEEGYVADEAEGEEGEGDNVPGLQRA